MTTTQTCRQCGGPLRADRTAVNCPGYVGSTGICWDCHLEATDGRGVESFRSFSVRGLVTGRKGAKALCREEAEQGFDDDLAGGCFVKIVE